MDACKLLKDSEIFAAFKFAPSMTEKGTLPTSMGTSCYWKLVKSEQGLKLVAHTKYTEQTYAGLRKRLTGVKDRADIGAKVYQSENKLYMLKRGVYLTFENTSPEIADEQFSKLAKLALLRLDDLAELQKIHR